MLIEWKGSPHFTPLVRPHRNLPEPPLIVLHTMAGSLAGTLAHFQSPHSLVSSHYGVGRKGEIHQYVDEKDGAWTNGRVNKPSADQIIQRGGNPNRYTITIEFEGKDRGGAIDEPQYQAGLWLIKQIAARWKIPLTRDYIIGHYEIDSVNKPSCPGPFFPWSRLMKDLESTLPMVSICHQGTPIAMGYLDSGTTYGPIRKIAEALGYTVKWDELSKKVDLSK
ncbi:N-acetylmuramoyl-L-alanine amidase [Ammoniphilus sp. YIM 78166]|uniref:N-acetylmuramoyl-L-alanine amidase n=1 Tax=Ammoniphilus sp. YIM 78166 TaxID=1644106 RepID=UPI00106FAC57|nr:N-acetylmuramoyl-L-alanine amidase [Ammoniphilus sp. YIM 78166]